VGRLLFFSVNLGDGVQLIEVVNVDERIVVDGFGEIVHGFIRTVKNDLLRIYTFLMALSYSNPETTSAHEPS
jgi:hypothetical protein